MLDNLIELRTRLLRTAAWFLLCFVACFYKANPLYFVVLHPLISRLPHSASLIATNVTATVFTPLRLAFYVAIFLSAPMFLWQIWTFVTPGLYKKERRPIQAAVCLSLLFFTLGVFFAYFVALPMLFSFFIEALPQGVQLLPDMSQSLDFILWMLTVFGLSFQVPLVCVLLVRANVVSVVQLQRLRPYSIICSFVLGMILTPPDVLSQLVLALPLCLLYECGIFLSGYYTSKKADHKQSQLS